MVEDLSGVRTIDPGRPLDLAILLERLQRPSVTVHRAAILVVTEAERLALIEFVERAIRVVDNPTK